MITAAKITSLLIPLKMHRSGCLVSANFSMLFTLRKLEEWKLNKINKITICR